MVTIQASGATHIGRRKSNQDAYCISDQLGLYAVADGMGGYQGGEIASQLALDTLREFFLRNLEDNEATWPFAYDKQLSLAENMVDVAVRLANAAIAAQRKGALAKMGTTLAMLQISPAPPPGSQTPRRVVIGHLGDSRVYRYRDGKCDQLTLDHSLYEQLKASGAKVPTLEEFPHGNVITKALGIEPKQRPDLSVEVLLPGDRFLLCSDGLTGPLSDAKIATYLAIQEPHKACQALVQAAYDAGGKDNITAVLVDVVARQERPSARAA